MEELVARRRHPQNSNANSTTPAEEVGGRYKVKSSFNCNVNGAGLKAAATESKPPLGNIFPRSYSLDLQRFSSCHAESQ